MPDITMCCNYDCPIKSKCYRYRAIPDEYWQSFSLFKPSITLNGSLPIKVECDHFWETETSDKVLPLEEIDKRNKNVS